MKRLIKIDKIPVKKLNVFCNCEGEHYLQLLSFEREEQDEDEYEELYVSLEGCKMYSWRSRLLAAWRVIRYGEYQNHGVLVGRSNLENIREYLKEVLEYWQELEKMGDEN